MNDILNVKECIDPAGGIIATLRTTNPSKMDWSQNIYAIDGPTIWLPTIKSL